jgi:hypothetical protein
MGYTGSAGAPGCCGAPGAPGADGTSVTIIGTVPTAGSSGSPQSNSDVIGTAYPSATYGNGVIAEDTGHLWVYSHGGPPSYNDVWVDVGQVKGDIGYTGSAGAPGCTGGCGPQGYTGSQGYVAISETAPVSPNNGDLWYDDLGGRMYIYYTDTDSGQWVDTNPSTQGYTGSTGSTGLASDRIVSPNNSCEMTLNNNGDLAFSGNNMRLKFSGWRNYQGTTLYTECQTGTNTVIWTSSETFASSARLTIHAEVWTGSGNYYSDFDTQTSELLLAVKIVNNVPTVAKVSVFGTVYTSDTILATYDAQINTSTNRVEVICIPDASVTQTVIVKTNYFESGSSGQEDWC